jgi:hypothetical protein
MQQVSRVCNPLLLTLSLAAGSASGKDWNTNPPAGREDWYALGKQITECAASVRFGINSFPRMRSDSKLYIEKLESLLNLTRAGSFFLVMGTNPERLESQRKEQMNGSPIDIVDLDRQSIEDAHYSKLSKLTLMSSIAAETVAVCDKSIWGYVLTTIPKK